MGCTSTWSPHPRSQPISGTRRRTLAAAARVAAPSREAVAWGSGAGQPSPGRAGAVQAGVEADHGVVVHGGPLLHFGHLGERQSQVPAELAGGYADLGGQSPTQGDGEATP